MDAFDRDLQLVGPLTAQLASVAGEERSGLGVDPKLGDGCLAQPGAVTLDNGDHIGRLTPVGAQRAEKRVPAGTGRIDWEDVRFFASLARHGSLSATARALGVNHATVARRIAALEEALRVKLFERWPTGYTLTAAGRQALVSTDSMESAAGALSQLKPAKLLSGLVRITAVPSLAETFLIPRLVALHDEHPLLDLEVNADRGIVSLSRYRADIALRFGRPEQLGLVGRRVADLAYRFYATPIWRTRIEQGGRSRFCRLR